MYNLNKTNLQLKSCQSLHPAQGCQQTVQCCQFHVWLRPSGYEHVADITQKQYKVYKNTFYIQWKVSAISLSNKSSWQTNAWRTSSLSHDSSSGAGMALAGSRTRQMQRIPWKFDGISGTKCRSLAQYITHKAHSPRNLRRLLPGTRTGYHFGDGRHWVRPHWLAASGQLGRSRLMTSRDRVLATTIYMYQYMYILCMVNTNYEMLHEMDAGFQRHLSLPTTVTSVLTTRPFPMRQKRIGNSLWY